MNSFQFDPQRHIPVTESVPDEEVDAEADFRRADIPPPSAWARTAVVIHRRTKQRAVVHRVDLITRQMRLWYPDRRDLPNEEQYDGRTSWQSLDGDWEPEITFSPEEIERQTADKDFEREVMTLDPSGLEFVMHFCDDPDPRKRLGKLRALRKSPVFATMMGTAPPPLDAGLGAAMPQESTTTKKGK